MGVSVCVCVCVCVCVSECGCVCECVREMCDRGVESYIQYYLAKIYRKDLGESKCMYVYISV